MIKLGEKQELEIVKQVEFGVYLSDPEEALLSGAEAPRVLLPVKQVPEGAKRGDRLTVFVYRDSKDRLIASTRMPKLCLHQVGMLTVKEVAKIGAFLDWGLEKDLLLPFAEQTRKVREEETCLAAVYTDKSGRLCATMKKMRSKRSERNTMRSIFFGNFCNTNSICSGSRLKKSVTGSDFELSAIFRCMSPMTAQTSGRIPSFSSWTKKKNA